MELRRGGGKSRGWIARACPSDLLYAEVARYCRKQDGQSAVIRALYDLQISSVAWGTSVKIDDHKIALFEANRIVAAKANSETCKTQTLSTNDTCNQPLSLRLHGRPMFQSARIDIIGHLRSQCNVNATTQSLISQHTVTTCSTDENNQTNLQNINTTSSTTNNVDPVLNRWNN
nr:unnamed protein product [Spirometra erinaceieuropaei]